VFGIFRLCLVAIAALTLSGQSVAMAIAPLSVTSPPMASMTTGKNCSKMPFPGSREKAACKGMTPQCIAQMGCTAPAALEPTVFILTERLQDRPTHEWPQAARILGRFYGPLPDPPRIRI
jgi:hypothetical protein